MGKEKYTKEQKQEYFKGLRERWQKCKEASEQDEDARAKWQAVNEQAGGKLSYTGFYFTLMDMKVQGLSGLPYVDAKTFDGWTASGFKVSKGQHSTISGITWLEVDRDDVKGEAKDNNFMIPKMYHLFHRSQVEEIIN